MPCDYSVAAAFRPFFQGGQLAGLHGCLKHFAAEPIYLEEDNPGFFSVSRVTRPNSQPFKKPLVDERFVVRGENGGEYK
jgi:hypothetical protein